MSTNLPSLVRFPFRKAIVSSVLTSVFAAPVFASLQDEIEQTEPTPVSAVQVSQQWQGHEGASLAIWQGFDHRWKRFVVVPGVGQVPHRISKLHNYVAPTVDEQPPQAHMAQSTGVDGNYMRPETRYTTINSSDYQVFHGQTQLNWLDTLNDAPHPAAVNQFRQTITLPTGFDSSAANLVLAGFELDVSCSDQEQPADSPCNSNGIWPYVFRIDLQQCQHQGLQADTCQLAVDIYRAWTPNKGGFQLPPIFSEVKPLNQRHSYQLTVRYTLLAPNEGTALTETNTDSAVALAAMQQRAGVQQRESATVATDPYAVTAITGFGFRVLAPSAIDPLWAAVGSDLEHRGRYIGQLSFSVNNAEREGQRWHWQQQQHVWSPISVVNADIESELHTLLLPVAQQPTENKASGRLCINSTDQAPAFSRWLHCGQDHWLMQWIYGDPQAQDSIPLESF